MTERLKAALARLNREQLELLVVDLLASLLVWQDKEMNEETLMEALSTRGVKE
jgi:hypothetical protein